MRNAKRSKGGFAMEPEYHYFLVVTSVGRWKRRRVSALLRRSADGEEWFSGKGWESADTIREALGRLDHRLAEIPARKVARYEGHFVRSQRRFERMLGDKPITIKLPDFRYRYYVLVNDSFPREAPYGLVRALVGEDGERVATFLDYFQPKTGWERGKAASRIAVGEPNSGTEEIAESEVEHYERLLVRRDEEIERTGYQYYFIVSDPPPHEGPPWLIRKRDTGFDITGEERFTRHLQWEPSDHLSRISSGRDYDEALPITEQEAMEYVAKVTRMVNGE